MTSPDNMGADGSGWLPIESALDAGYDSDVMVAGDDWVTVARLIDGQWWELNNHPTDAWGHQLYPTHWMPLPTPPVGDQT